MEDFPCSSVSVLVVKFVLVDVPLMQVAYELWSGIE